ncbi:glycyl-tRNA synthetase subunit alpha [Lactobacillus mulieris]|uniref:Glycyl-tRNA synthetase subunit alpha n=2 Tax=root TaxID=1 RepID=A0AAP3GW14_9LACO|nr:MULTISPECIES: hypothetical protein [Lactobacillus]EEU21594.2 hypothetical protein HMPREF0525_00528 [Lactobacillus jensenii 27-2-CHN]MCF1798058.1 glycyl-tRNA synthetase subunit alpha [Lactobacillus mulieris]MCF1847378.1 glycyl-tRNA synthetase subunit alpha [Lactobacillus mulieris]MCT7673927.1 glycyl-tRNA synthetase subunit alpha [Lactobacillus mulieris]MCT7772167.1 glycyl-tRNA synthetase subunit alpha [Lactobacillus mulieris]
MRRAEIDKFIQEELSKPPVDAQYAQHPLLDSLSEEEWNYLDNRLKEIEKTWENPYFNIGA